MGTKTAFKCHTLKVKEPCPDILHMQIGTSNVLSFKLINYDISENGHKHFDFPTAGEIE